MGSWGYGIYENDIALEFEDIYERKLASGISKERALSELEEMIYMDYDECILVLADLQIKDKGELFGKGEEVIDTIDKLLTEDELARWVDPKERVKELNKFRDYVEEYI